MKEVSKRKKKEIIVDYRAVFQNSPEAIVILDTKGRIVDLNDRLFDWLGYTSEEVRGKNLLRLPYMTKKSKLIAMEKYLARMTGQSIEPYELEFLTKDKRIRLGKVVGTPLRDEKGRVVQDLVMITDVTEERARQKHLSQHELIFNLSNDLLCVANTDGYFMLVNPAFEKVLGYKKEELLKTPFVNFVHPDDKRATLDEVSKLAQGAKTINFQNRYRTKSGKYKVIMWNATPQGKEIYAIGRDITQRLQFDERMRVLYERSADAVMILDPKNGKFVAGNPTTIKLFGVKDEKQFTSLSPWQISPKKQPDGQFSIEKAKNMIQKAMEQGSNLFEWKHQTVSGKEFYATVLLSRIDYADQQLLQATVRDISKEKKIELELKERASELEKINRLMTGRELKMVLLKKEIEEYKQRLKNVS